MMDSEKEYSIGKRNHKKKKKKKSGEASSYIDDFDDNFLPLTNVSRLMRRALPSNAAITKEAREMVQECVSEFVSFITGEASDKCGREKRRSINGDDVLWAMKMLGFHAYVEPLNVYLNKFRDYEKKRRKRNKEVCEDDLLMMSAEEIEKLMASVDDDDVDLDNILTELSDNNITMMGHQEINDNLGQTLYTAGSYQQQQHQHHQQYEQQQLQQEDDLLMMSAEDIEKLLASVEDVDLDNFLTGLPDNNITMMGHHEINDNLGQEHEQHGQQQQYQQHSDGMANPVFDSSSDGLPPLL